MRLVALSCLALLSGCLGPPGAVRVESFAAPAPGTFLYSARTDTVMTENDDGAAERLRRDWLAQALQAHAMCANGYVVDTRRFVPRPSTDAFANGGDIVYSGRCL